MALSRSDPEKTIQEFAACYLNSTAKLGKGVMITYKREDLPNDVGVLDLEKGRMNQLTEYTWLTGDTISLGRWRV